MSAQHRNEPGRTKLPKGSISPISRWSSACSRVSWLSWPDVAIYLLGMVEMTGVDLHDEIEAKIAKNAARLPAPAERRPR